MSKETNLLEMIQETSEFIRQRVNGKLPKTAIVLGTGLGAVVDHINIGLLESRHPYVVFVREAYFKVAGACTTVPHVVVVLPALAKDGSEIVL